MAYTKIIKVKSNLNLCLDYTSNPKKTERRSAEDLNRLLSYTQSNDKTEHQLYVSGFNCIPQNAYEIMMETKQRWRKPVKDGNILAYHIIQSFSPGEATPDQVHQIGCEFAQRFLADRFECTVSTHLDRGHLHNHIVVNSVSYADGKMFRSDFNTYYKGIRETSDELCRENRLSVIETDGKGKSYDEWLSGQTGKPTIRGMVRKDVEQAIAAADSFDGFITELQNMGYTVKYGPRVEHMAVRHKDAQRNIRIDRLDPRFSETALREYYHKLHRMPTKCSKNTGRKTPRQNRNGSPQNYSPLCSGRGIAASCRAGIRRYPALWLATITTAPCCGKPTTARQQSAATFCCVRIFCCSADTSSKRNSYGKTILKLWMNCWPTRKMQKSKSNSLPASAKFCIAKNVSRNVPRGKKNQITDPANESPAP